MFLHANKTKLSAGLAAIAVALAALIACPAAARADESMAHSYNDDGTARFYYTTDAALEAGYAGRTIYLDVDWLFTGTMQIADSQTITIDMNGHKIANQYSGEVIRLNENSNLTLTSSKSATFTYDGYTAQTHERKSMTTTTGGLVTGGYYNSDIGGIRLNANSKLTLDGVTVAGNRGSGIYTEKQCQIYLKDGAKVQNNYANDGGGIHVNGADTYIYLYGASAVQDNCAYGRGGGIYSNDDATRIQLEESSSISKNAATAGGGVYFNYSYFYILSNDKTGAIKNNNSIEFNSDPEYSYHGAGGVYVCTRKFGSNEGMLKGITVSGNSSYCAAGGIYLAQKSTRVIECTVTNNKAELGGGGIRVADDNNSIESCTITKNSCNRSQNSSSTDYGGGIYVCDDVDISLTGTCTIKDNTNGTGSDADDVFLGSSAYITGGVDASSKVGVRTDFSGERRIGKNVSVYTDGTYFVDRSGYYVTHGTDAGGDLWLRRAPSEGFLAKLNGKGSTRYKDGTTVVVNATSSDSTKAFWHWDTTSTTGLYPIGDYINDDNYYNAAITYTMPQNDTDAVAVYADRVAKVRVDIAKPVAGEAFATTAILRRTDSGTGGEGAIEAGVTWYEVAADGTRHLTSWTAEYGKSYVAVITLDQDQEQGLFFNSGIEASDVTVRTDSDSTTDASAAAASVNAVGTLCVETAQYKTALPEIINVYNTSICMNPGETEAELIEALPSNATVYLQGRTYATIATDKTAAISWPEGLLTDGKVADPGDTSKTYTVSVPLASDNGIAIVKGETLDVTVTVVAPKDVAAPEVDPASGTYQTSDLTDLKLPVTATCATSGATIKYAYLGEDGVTWGETKTYKDGLSLECPANGTASFTIKLWAEKTVDGKAVTSAETVVEYTLDDTCDKTLTIKCSDTALYGKDDRRWSPTFKVTGDLGKSVTVTAPEQGGRIFDHWVVDGNPVAGTTLAIDSFATDLDITAVYVPVVSKIDVGLEAPEADKAVAEKAEYVKIDAAGTTTDIISYFKDGAITWTPASGGGKTGHATAYTAMLSLDETDTTDGVRYVLADNPQLYVNGTSAEDLNEDIFILNDDDSSTLCISTPETAPYEYKSLGDLDDVELTFDEAKAFAAGDESGWNLPDQIEATYECGETGMLDIEWNEVEGFDENATGEQELTATGTVVYPANVDNTGAPKTVTVKIKVATPEKDDSGDDKGDDSGKGDSGDGEKGDGSGKQDGKSDGNSDKSGGGSADSAEKASGKASAKLVETGDAAWTALPVAALGIVAAAIGTVLAKRRN